MAGVEFEYWMRGFSPPLPWARAHGRGEEEDSNFFAPDEILSGLKDFAVGILGKVQRENAKKVAGVKKSRENSSLNIWGNFCESCSPTKLFGGVCSGDWQVSLCFCQHLS